jgi:hypothetical protein
MRPRRRSARRPLSLKPKVVGITTYSLKSGKDSGEAQVRGRCPFHAEQHAQDGGTAHRRSLPLLHTNPPSLQEYRSTTELHHRSSRRPTPPSEAPGQREEQQTCTSSRGMAGRCPCGSTRSPPGSSASATASTGRTATRWAAGDAYTPSGIAAGAAEGQGAPGQRRNNLSANPFKRGGPPGAAPSPKSASGTKCIALHAPRAVPRRPRSTTGARPRRRGARRGVAATPPDPARPGPAPCPRPRAPGDAPRCSSPRRSRPACTAA